MATFQIHTGDALEVSTRLEAGSVQTVITSPPYFGLRDYGTGKWVGGDEGCDHRKVVDTESAVATSTLGGGKKTTGHIQEGFKDACGRCGAKRADKQLGLEQTPELYVERLVSIFREVRRVLRDDGTLWLNLGDSYASHDPGGYRAGEFLNPGGRPPAKQGAHRNRAGTYVKRSGALKPKDLIGIPWMVAFALRADGWYLRSDIIWHKPNPMPESVTDRPTKAHEYLFLLSKGPRYFYDAEAIKEPSTHAGKVVTLGAKSLSRGQARGANIKPSGNGNAESVTVTDSRNRRSVWTVPTAPFPGAHFATFPPELIKPCILAGTSERGCCPNCRAPWERVVERKGTWAERKAAGGTAGNVGVSDTYQNGVHGSRVNHDLNSEVKTIGRQPSCRCDAGEPMPCTVFDPFTGSGTTALVALRHQRNFIGAELNPEYVEMARERIRNDAPMFNVEVAA